MRMRTVVRSGPVLVVRPMLLVRRIGDGLVAVLSANAGGVGRRLRHRFVVDGTVTKYAGHRLERGGVECQQQEDSYESSHGWPPMGASIQVSPYGPSLTTLATEALGREPDRSCGVTVVLGAEPKRRGVMPKTGKAATFSRSAELVWEGDLAHGSGEVKAPGGAFDAPVRFPSLRGEPAETTSPEELLAASHASCFGIGLRSVIGRHGASAARLAVRATITAEKGPRGIRVLRSHLGWTSRAATGNPPLRRRY